MKKETQNKGAVRLHVAIAHSGLCSRRAAEKWIRDGRVQVNGEVVTGMGIPVGPDDKVVVDGQPLRPAKNVTILLNKPKRVVTTMSDPQGRRTVADLIPDMGATLKPVGRLDFDTEGLLICTSDGELAMRLAHPRYGIEKEYQAQVKGIPDEKALDQLRKGIYLEGRKTAPAKVDLIFGDERKAAATLRIVLHEGRKRQIREMCSLVGHPVTDLKRVRIGPFRLKGMRPGEARPLTKPELLALRKSVGLTDQG